MLVHRTHRLTAQRGEAGGLGLGEEARVQGIGDERNRRRIRRHLPPEEVCQGDVGHAAFRELGHPPVDLADRSAEVEAPFHAVDDPEALSGHYVLQVLLALDDQRPCAARRQAVLDLVEAIGQLLEVVISRGPTRPFVGVHFRVGHEEDGEDQADFALLQTLEAHSPPVPGVAEVEEAGGYGEGQCPQLVEPRPFLHLGEGLLGHVVRGLLLEEVHGVVAMEIGDRRHVRSSSAGVCGRSSPSWALRSRACPKRLVSRVSAASSARRRSRGPRCRSSATDPARRHGRSARYSISTRTSQSGPPPSRPTLPPQTSRSGPPNSRSSPLPALTVSTAPPSVVALVAGGVVVAVEGVVSVPAVELVVAAARRQAGLGVAVADHHVGLGAGVQDVVAASGCVCRSASSCRRRPGPGPARRRSRPGRRRWRPRGSRRCRRRSRRPSPLLEDRTSWLAPPAVPRTE